MIPHDEEEGEFEPLPAVNFALLERVKNTFKLEYFPIQNWENGVIFMSTEEIYHLMLNIYPNPIAFENFDLAAWLHENGYKFEKTSEHKFEWMLSTNLLNQ